MTLVIRVQPSILGDPQGDSSQSSGLGYTPGITTGRRSSLHLPTHKLCIQPPATWPKPKLLASERCCSEFQHWNFSCASLGHFLASSLPVCLADGCPFPKTKTCRSLSWRKRIFRGDAMCFARMSLSGHCVPTQSTCSACLEPWLKSSGGSVASGGASSVVLPDGEPLHGSLSNKIHKKARHGFHTRTPMPAGMFPGSAVSVTKAENNPRSPMDRPVLWSRDPWKHGRPVWPAQTARSASLGEESYLWE